MNRDENANIAQTLLDSIGKGAESDAIAALFRDDVEFEVAGDVGALPWIGRQTGRKAVADFFRDLRHLTQPVRFDVQAILADERPGSHSRRAGVEGLRDRKDHRDGLCDHPDDLRP